MEKNIYLNISEDKKKRLNEYQKYYREAKTFQYNNELNSFLIVILIIF